MDNLKRYHLELGVNLPDRISLRRLVSPLTELGDVSLHGPRQIWKFAICGTAACSPYTVRHRFRLRFADMFAKLTLARFRGTPEAWTGRGKFTVDTFEQVSRPRDSARGHSALPAAFSQKKKMPRRAIFLCSRPIKSLFSTSLCPFRSFGIFFHLVSFFFLFPAPK